MNTLHCSALFMNKQSQYKAQHAATSRPWKCPEQQAYSSKFEKLFFSTTQTHLYFPMLEKSSQHTPWYHVSFQTKAISCFNSNFNKIKLYFSQKIVHYNYWYLECLSKAISWLWIEIFITSNCGCTISFILHWKGKIISMCSSSSRL